MLRSLLADSSKTFWLPEQASTIAPTSDAIFYAVYWITIFFTVLVTALMVFFIVRYRHRKGAAVQESTAGHSTTLELTWTIIPTIIVLILYYYAFRGYMHMSVEPPNAYEIVATGRMWKWGFVYPNGHDDEELHVPADRPVRIILKSEDVIHSLFLPAFRVKKDVVPGRFNRLWFEAKKLKSDPAPEDHELYCAAYCGINHSTMVSKVIVHTPDDFDAWLTKASNWQLTLSPVDAGAKFYKSKGCNQCHTVDGTALTNGGPTWKDMFGSTVHLEGGASVLADEAYVRESIAYPTAKIHKGFSPIMPAFSMDDRDMSAIIAYMKSISVNFKGDITPLKQIAKPTEPVTEAK